MGVECLPDAALASLSGAGSIAYIGLALSLSSRTATDYAVSGLTRYCIEPLWLRRWPRKPFGRPVRAGGWSLELVS